MDGEQEVVGFGRTEGFNRIGFTWDEESFEFISDATTDNEHWVVVRIDMSGDDGAEGVYLWVDPIPEIQPALNVADAFTNETVDKRLTINDGFDGIRIKTAGGVPFSFFIDEIRLGFAYSDVSTIEEEIPEDLVAREQFRYPTGENLEGLGSAGDQWAGPWEKASNGGGDAVIEEGNVQVTGISGLDNKVNMQSDGSINTRFIRPLASRITDDGNGYWFSFLADIDVQGGGVAQGGFAVESQPSVLFGKKFGPTNVSIIDLMGNSAQQTIDTEVQANVPAWYVIYVKFSGDAEQDSAWLWLNTDPAVEPSQDDADAVIFTTLLNDGIENIFFRAEGTSDGTVSIDYRVDEIHFGTTFESVVPQGDSGGPVTGIEDLIDNEFRLFNYPNPFTGTTTISYRLEFAGATYLSLVNLQGRELITLVDSHQTSGQHTVTWDGTDGQGNKLPPGIYFYRLWSNDQAVTKRLILMED